MSKKIFLSPSSQTGNVYSYGNTNEAVVCGKIADACEEALKRCGFEVKYEQFDTLANRVAHSNKWGADLHVPIHTNAHNQKVTGTRIMCYDLKGEGYKASKAVFDALAPITPGTSEAVQTSRFYEILHSHAPCVYVEADFHDVPAIAKWLIENTVAVGEAICKGICNYFGVKYIEAKAEAEAEHTPAPVPEVSETKYTLNLRTLKDGCEGEDVKALQILLLGNGFPCGKWGADGVFGISTENAVKEYQQKKKLQVDGIAGPKTMSSLLGV